MRVRSEAPEAGFTLIELLVVLCIVGVLAVVLGLSIGPGEAAKARTEARRLGALLELSLAEARASGTGIAWSPAPGSYEFLRKTDEGEWRGFASGSPYRRRTLPAGVSLEAVQLDAHPVRDGELVVISPHGLAGAIRVTIIGGGERIVLRGGVVGRIEIETSGGERNKFNLHEDDARIHAG